MVISVHVLDEPSEEDLRWLQERNRPNILLSVIRNHTAGISELMLAEYNSVNVRIRCSSLDLNKCPDGPVSGSTIRVAYDFWYPITFEDENGQVAGFYQDVLLIIANRLNLTVEMIYNYDSGAWGKLLENGSWTGLLGMLHRGEADVVSSAMIRSMQRIAAFDFSLTVSYMEMKLHAKRLDGAKLSSQNYFWEFDRYIWISILVTALVITICMTAIMIRTRQCSAALSISSIAVLNALLNRGMAPSVAKSKKISFKILLLVLFSFTTVLNVSYRSCLNAFLAVVIPFQAINNLEDVLEHSRGISMWPGGEIEVSLASGKEGSTEKMLYDKWKNDQRAAVKNYDEGLKDVIEHGYVLMGEAESITVLKSYTCDVLQVKDYRYMRSNLALAFEKDSRYKKVFDREILNMKVSGVIDRLNEAYIGKNKRPDSMCDQNSVRALGFTNVFTPFSLIPLGAIFGIIILTLETMFMYTLPKNNHKSLTCASCENACFKKLVSAEIILNSDKTSNYWKIKLLQELLLIKHSKHEKDWHSN